MESGGFKANRLWLELKKPADSFDFLYKVADFGDFLDFLFFHNLVVQDIIAQVRTWISPDCSISSLAFARFFTKKLIAFEIPNNAVQDYDLENLKSVLLLPELSEIDIVGNPIASILNDVVEPEDQLLFLRKNLLYPLPMVDVPKATFWRGYQDGEPNKYSNYKPKETESPNDWVEVPSFKIGKYAVTTGEFRAFMKAQKEKENGWQTLAEIEGWAFGYDQKTKNWGRVKGLTWEMDVWGERQTNDLCPVIYVSYYDALAYCNWLSEKEGLDPYYSIDVEIEEEKSTASEEEEDSVISKKANINVSFNPKGKHSYRLPSEAEWERAARANVERAAQTKYAGSDNITKVAWYEQNSQGADVFIDKENLSAQELFNNKARTQPVGQKAPNALGLYDMSGNVFEWCADHWHENYKGAPTDGSAWTEGGESERRVLRGGSWDYSDIGCRVSDRFRYYPDSWDMDVGFRVSRH